MSDDQTTGEVRRFGRRDRKKSLDSRGPLFPPEDLPPDIEQTEDHIEPELAVEADAVEIPEPNVAVIDVPKSQPMRVIKWALFVTL